MSRTEVIRLEFVEFIPKTLESGVLYVSEKYKTASHLCCCGCGSKVVTPLKPGGWQLTKRNGKVSLYPSIGSWSLPCQSHYWIRGNKITWARKFSKGEIEDNRRHDQRVRERHFDRPAVGGDSSWSGARALQWLRRLFS